MNIIVTGGTKGIGRAIADLFAEHQFNVAVCARTQSDLDQMTADYATHFPKIQFLPFQADLQQKSEVLKFADFIQSQWDTINVLVNNTGTFTPGSIHSEEEGTLEKMIEVNLYSAYHLTRADMIREAVDRWIQAAKFAEQRFSHKEAIQHLEQGLTLIDKLDDSDQHQKAFEVLSLLTKLALSEYGFGLPGFKKMNERFIKVAGITGKSKDTFLEARSSKQHALHHQTSSSLKFFATAPLKEL